jgi:hypothetical protein
MGAAAVAAGLSADATAEPGGAGAGRRPAASGPAAPNKSVREPALRFNLDAPSPGSPGTAAVGLREPAAAEESSFFSGVRARGAPARAGMGTRGTGAPLPADAGAPPSAAGGATAGAATGAGMGAAMTGAAAGGGGGAGVGPAMAAAAMAAALPGATLPVAALPGPEPPAAKPTVSEDATDPAAEAGAGGSELGVAVTSYSSLPGRGESWMR